MTRKYHNQRSQNNPCHQEEKIPDHRQRQRYIKLLFNKLALLTLKHVLMSVGYIALIPSKLEIGFKVSFFTTCLALST